MKWKTLQPASRSAIGVSFGYAVRNSNSKSVMVEFVLCTSMLRKLKWSDGQPLRLEVSEDGSAMRLLAVSALGKASRKLSVNPHGRGRVAYPSTGDLAEVFGRAARGMAALTIVEINSESVIFERP